MATTFHEANPIEQDLPAHRETFHDFTRIVLFAALHIGVVLGALSLAFLGHVPILALLLGLGGTAALIVLFLASA